MNEIAQTFPQGHRLRLSISTSYFPLAWPSPKPVELTVFAGASTLELPARPPRPSQDEQITFKPAEGEKPLATTRLQEGDSSWIVERDLATDHSSLKVIKDDGVFRFDDYDWTVARDVKEEYGFTNDDLRSLKGEVRTVHELKRGSFRVKTDTWTELSSDEENFYIKAEMKCYEGDELVYSKEWDEEVKRDNN